MQLSVHGHNATINTLQRSTANMHKTSDSHSIFHRTWAHIWKMALRKN